MGKEQEFLTQLKWYAYWQLNQGYALQVKPPKYELLILVELHKIERFSSQYEQELKCLSRCIRRYIWKEENEDNLWCYLKIINIVFEESEKAAAIDDFWGLGRIITYTKCLCACCGELKTDKREVLNKIIDSIQIANAKVALEERWKNIRSSPDGDKAFIDIFQDIFENAITKYETDFICSLDETDILYRMVKKKYVTKEDLYRGPIKFKIDGILQEKRICIFLMEKKMWHIMKALNWDNMCAF